MHGRWRQNWHIPAGWWWVGRSAVATNVTCVPTIYVRRLWLEAWVVCMYLGTWCLGWQVGGQTDRA